VFVERGAAGDEDVVAALSGDGIGAATADHNVAPVPAEELVVAAAAHQDIISAAAVDRVVSGFAEDESAAGDGWIDVDQIIAPLRVDNDMTGEAEDAFVHAVDHQH